MTLRMLTEEEQAAQMEARGTILLTAQLAKRINQLVAIHRESVLSFEMVLHVAEFASACSHHGLDSVCIEQAVEEMYPNLATAIQATLESMRQDNE